MSTGAFGENFPYSNFHNLNMDWVISVIKDFKNQYEHIENIITEGEETITNLTNEQLQEAITNFTRTANLVGEDILNSLPDDYSELAEIVQKIADTKPFSLNRLNAGDGLAVNLSPGEIVGQSTPYDLSEEQGSCVCRTLIPVKVGDVVYCKAKNDYRNVFGLFFYDTDKKFIRRVDNSPATTVLDNGYVMLMAFDCSSASTFNDREYYLNLNTNYSYTEYGINKDRYDIDRLTSNRPAQLYIPLYSLTIENGYYQADNNFSFAPDSSGTFKSIKLPVLPGEKYKITCRCRPVTQLPIAYFLTADGHLISSTGAITSITTFRGYAVTIPANCYYMICHTDNGGGNASSNVTLTIEKEMAYDKADAPLSGKKVLVFGDSFSAVESRWRTEFYKRTKAVELCCIARGGAHLCDYADTVLDGDYTTVISGSERNNTIDNMITFIENNLPNANPDIIIIEAYINDMPTREQLTTYSNQINNGWSAPWISLNSVDRTITEGAMRWQVSKLRSLFPYSTIIYISPIETAYFDVEYMKLKDDKMTDMTQRLACDIVHGIRCGITAEFETQGANGRFLEDGIHPNATGGIILGRYIAQHVANEYSDSLTR